MSAVTQKTKQVGEGAGRLIRQHPLPSALSAFGAGFGLGLLVSVLLPEAHSRRDAAISRRVLDAITSILPEAVAKRVS